MPFVSQRRIVLLVASVLIVLALISLKQRPTQAIRAQFASSTLSAPTFRWRDLPQRHPVDNYTGLPHGPIASIPNVQATFETETEQQRVVREARLKTVKEAFVHSWNGYKLNAWLQDEVAPLSGGVHNGFGGWGATLVDSLDTLWIMGLRKDFDLAVAELEKIDFTSNTLDELNVFETSIRYLGGLLSAYDVSGQQSDILLQKAVELGDMLYVAFDTPNRMPVTRWDWKNAAEGGAQEAARHTLLSEIGSFTLEFTRLSQLTGNDKWYDAITRVTDTMQAWQNSTKIKGLWPVTVNAQHMEVKDNFFSLGGMSDSFYEYLPKQHLMLGGRSTQYRQMYLTALESAKEHLLFHPLNPNDKEMLIAGTLDRKSVGSVNFLPQGEHLSCFAGGMVALAAKIFSRHEELDTARQLVDGCVWAYESMPSGLMPEVFTAVTCGANCSWSKQNWLDAVETHAIESAHSWDGPPESPQIIIAQNSLPPGMVEIPDPRYSLRPEAIESLFVLYRVTGDRTLQDKAWKMFEAINAATRTDIAYAAVNDVTQQQPALTDSMESYWTAETLKYFYLMFSEPDVISLDEFVLNTEAHPLLRPTD